MIGNSISQSQITSIFIKPESTVLKTTPEVSFIETLTKPSKMYFPAAEFDGIDMIPFCSIVGAVVPVNVFVMRSN